MLITGSTSSSGKKDDDSKRASSTNKEKSDSSSSKTSDKEKEKEKEKEKDSDKEKDKSKEKDDKKSAKTDDEKSGDRSSPKIKSLDEIRRDRQERQRQERAKEIREQRERERQDRLKRERERLEREKMLERQRERERERERERRRQQLIREREFRERQERERLRLQREIERQRELERQRERERREREERERLERERRERIERERLERERIERDRLQRIERERLERLERERLERERLDRQRLERERLERDRRSLKRPAAPFERGDPGHAQKPVGFWQEPKRAAMGEGRSRDFFGSSVNDRDRRDRANVTSDRRDSRGSHRDEPRQAAGGRRSEEWSRADERRLKKDERDRRSDESHRGGRDKPTGRDSDHPRGSRDRGLHDSRSSHESKAWAVAGGELSGANIGLLGAAAMDPQKRLNILLERAGVGNILGPGQAVQSHSSRADLGKSVGGMDEPSWRAPDPRDSRPPIPQADRGAGFPHGASGLSAHVDARFGSLPMDDSHRSVSLGGGGVESSKPPARDWRDTHGQNLSSRDRDALAARERDRSRDRGAEVKQNLARAGALYDARDTRAPVSRDSMPPRGAWGTGLDSRQVANPALSLSGGGRPIVDDRSRAAVPARDAALPPWNQPGAPSLATPVARGPYNGSAVPGPDRRHAAAADVRYDPYKAPPRVSVMRRY